jgi:hypothetical protein
MKADLVDYIRDARPGECEILKSPCKASEICRIRHWITNSARKHGIDIDWGGAGLALSHASGHECQSCIVVAIEIVRLPCVGPASPRNGKICQDPS